MPRVRGLMDLVHDSIEAITNLVEDTYEDEAQKHVDVLSSVPSLEEAAESLDAAHRATAGLVFDSIRLINRGVQQVGTVAASLAQRALGEGAIEKVPLLADPKGQEMVSFWVDTAQSALNAVAGDFLAARDNGLAIPMGFYQHGEPLTLTPESLSQAIPAATPRLCIFIHGLGCNETSWSLGAPDAYAEPDATYGLLLARDLGYTPLYVRYNTGLHVSRNGRDLAAVLEALVGAHPGPVQQIVLVGHSMGGLVARSAAHYAHVDGRAWVKLLTHLLCIGTPNLGVPLEKAGNVLASLLSAFDTPGTQVPAKILNARSPGIKDLRFGYVVDEDWTDEDPDALLTDQSHDVPLVDSVTYGFIAARLFMDAEHPLGELLGDLLVRVPSASGTGETTRDVPFHIGKVVHGLNHIALLNHPDVYAQIRCFLTEADRRS